MFCKNARTKLAMADESTPKPTAPVSQQQQQQQQKSTTTSGGDASSTAASAKHPSEPTTTEQQLASQFPPGLMSILQQDPDECCDNKFANMNMANNLQLLERQMQFLQEEHAQRMLLQRMAANRMMLQQQAAAAAPFPMQPFPPQPFLQQPNMALSSAAAAAAAMPPALSPHEQQAQLMHMRQMMELRNRQREGLAPSNPRASAA
jgi:hypothetical protein